MATRTEIATETDTQHPDATPQSQIPHNSGFSTYTPEGNWSQQTQDRQPYDSPSRNPFQGEGRILRPSSAPPNPQDQKERSGTPGAPYIPTTQLPTPYPTGPRRRRINPGLGTGELRNEESVYDEIQAVQPGYQPERYSYVPESVAEEARVHEMLTETTPDPRSPQDRRTPIPFSPRVNPGYTESIQHSRTLPAQYDTQVPRNSPRSSPNSSNGSSIRIIQPLDARDRIVIPPNPPPNLPELQPPRRTYQSQFESAMGSALDRTQPALTNSSQPKRYPTPRDALEDVGEQCRQLGEQLGIRRIENMQLSDHIQAVRALAEAREADLPLWVASRVREPALNQELSRLHSVVRQPEVALIVPEDSSLPDPWGLTRRLSPQAEIPPSWQQLEQQRALEREIWRENIAQEVRRNASAVVNQTEAMRNSPNWRGHDSLYDPIPHPTNPAIPSTTIYPPSSAGSEQIFQSRTRETGPRVREPTESEQTYQPRDVPPHQTPAYAPLKPGSMRPEGYKYTPFPRVFNTDPSLRQSRRRLREILEEVEGEKNEERVGTHSHNSTSEDRSLDNESRQRIPIRENPRTRTSVQFDETIRSNDRQEMSEEEIRIQNWERRGNRETKSSQTPSGKLPASSRGNPPNPPPNPSPPNPPPPPSSPPNPPPPPSSPPPPPPSPPPPPPNQGDSNDVYSSNVEVTKENDSVRVRTKIQSDEKSTRDAITRESKLEIRKPTAFDGSDRELWRPFLSDCYRMFVAKPTIYSTDQSKVTYASSWFTGAAARYYQNQVEQELENGLWIPSLHEWPIFIREFGRLFGLHDEVLHAQASLDKVIQRFGESFGDFLVRFEDAALRTQYNDPARRWRLLLQIRRDLRDRLTLVGRIPSTFDEVVKRLLDIDGAREAFRETGLTGSNNQQYPTRRPNQTLAPSNATPGPGPSTMAYNNRIRNSNSTPRNNTNDTTAKSAQLESRPNLPTFRISREERDRRMKEGLCIRCGGKGHFGKECTTHSHTAVGRRKW
ncbi:hypothetical protein K435DRAFT_803854 [Dendrothele bispora CBS 962.96]|uniref:CCHC-type domain-containing protein n=1 Tax=Dendrothele bispora (strain CBS 962.96) TaxID=1314807 RepID=A0A4V6T571_DENBC|nr:hypothetical protein K435DRAFT_803854 [Dendrothele bispora CBS 962.96]